MTTELPDSHSPEHATGPLALKSNLVLGPNARKLASQLQNAAYNCGYEDAHPANATTRQAKADTKCREVLAALYAECDRLAAAEAKTNSYIVDNARLAEQVENLRADELRAVLRELVALSDMKARLENLHAMGHGTDWDSYHKRNPEAWRAARLLALGPNGSLQPLAEGKSAGSEG